MLVFLLLAIACVLNVYLLQFGVLVGRVSKHFVENVHAIPKSSLLLTECFVRLSKLSHEARTRLGLIHKWLYKARKQFFD